MSYEDIAFSEILSHLNRKAVNVLSAHPPSGKAYDTDLIRLPAKSRNSGRYHIDIIFEFKNTIFLIEVKGSTSESEVDIKKLRTILTEYSTEELVRLIRKRSHLDSIAWENIRNIVPVIGAVVCDTDCPDDFAFLVTGLEHRKTKLVVGARVESEARTTLNMVFGTE